MRFTKRLLTIAPPIVILFYFTYDFLSYGEKINVPTLLPESSLLDPFRVFEFQDEKLQKQNVCNGDAFIHLFQQIVTSGEVSVASRKANLDTFQRNVNHSCVRAIYVLEETWHERSVYLNNISDSLKKVKFIPFGREPYFQDMFRIMTEYLIPRFKPGDIWMVTHSNIVLGAGFEQLHNAIDNRTVIALSRHARNCKERNICLDDIPRRSMDSILGSMKIPTSISDSLQFGRSTPAAEHEVTYHFKKHGYRTVNPCKSIITHNNDCYKKHTKSKATNLIRMHLSPIMPQSWPPAT